MFAPKIVLLSALVAICIAVVLLGIEAPAQNPRQLRDANDPDAHPVNLKYRALDAISSGNLTIYPVVAAATHNTSDFLTLDEGLRSGQVVITEAGQVQGLQRRPVPLPRGGSAEVNRLVLINNSDRPLILLAGEIVTGGKQDRVIGKDRLVPANSDPVDLSVFCVEPGRWVATSDKFGGLSSQMAQPAVRERAMAEKDQNAVWNGVRHAQSEMAKAAPPASGAAGGSGGGIMGTSSYAKVMDNAEVKQKVDAVALPLQRSYQELIQQLRQRQAVGVVVAVNGRIIWADMFASTSLLEKYWPKLIRSYAAEALTARGPLPRDPDPEAVAGKSAQLFLDQLTGRREVAEVEPGLYRHLEATGPGFKVFALRSLLPKENYDLHIAKMATATGEAGVKPLIPPLYR